jgi:hypothetical protein
MGFITASTILSAMLSSLSNELQSSHGIEISAA